MKRTRNACHLHLPHLNALLLAALLAVGTLTFATLPARTAWATENASADIEASDDGLKSENGEQPDEDKEPLSIDPREDDALPAEAIAPTTEKGADDELNGDGEEPGGPKDDSNETTGEKPTAAMSAASSAETVDLAPVTDPEPMAQMTAAATAGVLADGDYIIRSTLAARMVLDVSGGSKASGANVQLYTYNATAAQKWRFHRDTSTGLYTITSLVSGKLLDVSGASTRNGANVQVWNSNGTNAQKWRIAPDGAGWRIESALTPGFVLDISGARASNGTNAQGYRANSTAAQRFDLIALTPDVAASTAQVAEGAYVISIGTGKTLDVSGGSRASGANVQQYTANSTYAQRFYLDPDGKGFYRIFNVGSGLALDVSGADLLPGANVQQYAWNGTNAQLWSLSRNADNTYQIVSKANGLALDISGASTANGGNLQVWTPNSTKAQKFTLTASDLLSAGTVTLYSTASTGLVATVRGSSTASGTALQLAAGSGAQSQRFVAAKVSGGYTLRAACSGLYVTTSSSAAVQSANATTWTASLSKSGSRRGIVLAAPDGRVIAAASASSGAALSMATRTDAGTQAFCLSAVPLIGDGPFIVTNVATGKVLDAAGGKRVNGTNIQVYASNGSNAQKYRFVSLGNDYFTICNASSGKALDVAGGSKNSGANVQLYKSNGTNAQKWKADLLDGGRFRFTNAISGMTLDVANAQGGNGTNVLVDNSASASGQYFTLTPTSLAREAVNLGVPSVWQNPELPTGCESVALTNALMYYGFNLSKTEIADRYMPWSGSDFVYAFMGNPHSTSGSAIMAPGITNTANSYLTSKGSSLRATNLTGTSFDGLYAYIDSGAPVVVWSTMYFGNRGNALASSGGYTMYQNTHAVTIAGYNADKSQILVSDPLSGSVWRDAARFRSLYDQMGKQAVVIQ